MSTFPMGHRTPRSFLTVGRVTPNRPGGPADLFRPIRTRSRFGSERTRLLPLIRQCVETGRMTAVKSSAYNAVELHACTLRSTLAGAEKCVSTCGPGRTPCAWKKICVHTPGETHSALKYVTCLEYMLMYQCLDTNNASLFLALDIFIALVYCFGFKLLT